MQVSELKGGLLDYWVAKAAGKDVLYIDGTAHILWVRRGNGDLVYSAYAPSRCWYTANSIIKGEGICTSSRAAGSWRATCSAYRLSLDGATPLEAALRCYVGIKMGATVADLREPCLAFEGLLSADI